MVWLLLEHGADANAIMIDPLEEDCIRMQAEMVAAMQRVQSMLQEVGDDVNAQTVNDDYM